jgi:flagellar biogenesis protein FliO
MGSGLISFILVIPLFFFFKYLIQKYREKIVKKYKQSKIWKAWAGTSVYKWYTKYDELYG